MCVCVCVCECARRNAIRVGLEIVTSHGHSYVVICIRGRISSAYVQCGTLKEGFIDYRQSRDSNAGLTGGGKV